MIRHPFLYSILFVGLAVFILFALLMCGLVIGGGSGRSLLPFGSVAVIKIEGAIFDSSDTIKEIQKLKKNHLVKAVVVRINSPGGGVAPSQEIFEELKKLRLTKKVVVSMASLAASGGYYIATAADKIYASPGTITGSIGVIMQNFAFQDVLKWVKVQNRVIKSGHFKDAGSPFREMSDEERTYFQNLLDNMYAQFKKAVSEGRHLDPEKVSDLAEGKIYTGEQALQLGLIDGLGTLYDAIDEAKKMAGLSEDANVIWPRENSSPWDWVSSKVSHVFAEGLQSVTQKFWMPVIMYTGVTF